MRYLRSSCTMLFSLTPSPSPALISSRLLAYTRHASHQNISWSSPNAANPSLHHGLLALIIYTPSIFLVSSLTTIPTRFTIHPLIHISRRRRTVDSKPTRRHCAAPIQYPHAFSRFSFVICIPSRLSYHLHLHLPLELSYVYGECVGGLSCR